MLVGLFYAWDDYYTLMIRQVLREFANLRNYV
jgi:hypothetical protein